MNSEYEMRGIISANEVPNWARRPYKWDDVVDKVVQLGKGMSLPIHFPNGKLAKTVRNTIRDRANMRLEAPLIRTRLVQNSDGTAVVYFIMIPYDNNPGISVC